MAGNDSIYTAKKAASLVLTGTSAGMFLQSDNSAKIPAVYFPTVVPPSGTGGASFVVRAWGRWSTGTSGTALATLYYGTSITAASNTSIAALSARTVATTGNWMIEAKLVWDSVSAKLNGVFWGVNGDTPTIDSLAVTTQKTSVDLSVAGNGLGIGVTFGTANASNTANLEGFSLEVL